MNIRPSLAGTWYPADQVVLERELARYFRSAEPQLAEGDQVLGLLVPHAGHRYCGRIAAQAFAALPENPPDTVVVISPLHRYHPAPLLTNAHQAYSTPLGLVEIDLQLRDQLSSRIESSAGLKLERVEESNEHAIEVGLPFLQWRYGPLKILPIMMANQSHSVVEALSQVLLEVLAGRDCLMIASSDLSHYQPKYTATGMDADMLNRIVSLDATQVLRAEAQDKAYACGPGAIAVMLQVTKGLGANSARILDYTTSAEVSGDSSSVVGYGAVAILRSQN